MRRRGLEIEGIGQMPIKELGHRGEVRKSKLPESSRNGICPKGKSSSRSSFAEKARASRGSSGAGVMGPLDSSPGELAGVAAKA